MGAGWAETVAAAATALDAAPLVRLTPAGCGFSVRDEPCTVCCGPVLLVNDGTHVEGLCQCDDESRATPVAATIEALGIGD